jgi:hypothetical protein
MNTKLMGLVLLVLGVVLLFMAASAGDSVSSFFSELFQGTPSGKTIALLVAGAVATVLGVIRLARPAH